MEDKLKADAGEFTVETDADHLKANPEYIDTDANDQLYLSEELFKAVGELIYAELGDKTFCLIIIFTISWTNWNSPSPIDTIEVCD
jgi:hypothetical protein